LEAIEVAQGRLPSGLEILGLAQPQQFLAECERQEGAEDMAADRAIAGMEDGSRIKRCLRGTE
jgi:hypothetical protein